jgi:hypothetical protein
MLKIMKKIILAGLLLTASFFVGYQLLHLEFDSIAQDFGSFDDHSYDQLPNLVLPDDTYISYTAFRNSIGTNSANILAINPSTWGKIIRIDTAEELYRFSIDVSYNLKYTTFETKLTQPAIAVLMSLHYTLGSDIDYSVMKSKQFNPIGYDFVIEGIPYAKSFTGIFDGNGFEIRNLYFSGYDKLIEILYPGTDIETEIAYTKYYSMFAYNQGTIMNFGLINPTFEFTFESDEIFRTSSIVGYNGASGNVHHVYTIDTRTSALTAGVRMVASAGQAAGILFDNYGVFNNAYYVSRVVINASYGSRFTVQPVIYTNHSGGIISNLAFDDTVYQETVTIGGSTYAITTPNGLATSLTTAQLRSSNTTLGSSWYYYPAENNPTAKYPSVLGLNQVSGNFTIVLTDNPADNITISNYYVISSAIDLIAFSKMLNYTRETGLTPFRQLNYIITENIDMSQVAQNAYVTPTVEFSGILAGDSSETYIYDLRIKNGIASGSYYAGMFSILSGAVYNLIFYNGSVTLSETDSFAGVPNYVGLIAGQMVGGHIQNVLVDTTIDLGHATLGELYAGGIVGQASGVISGVYAEGFINANSDHIYRTDILINPSYHIGGIIGATSITAPLVLTDAYNQTTVNGPGTTSTQMTVSSNPTVFMGGVIGKITNTATASHVIGLLTNQGTITINELKSASVETQYVGGVIGQSSGLAYVMNTTQGKFRNLGSLNTSSKGTNLIVAAGVLTSNHSQSTEFVHLYNETTGLLSTNNFTNVSYTTLIYNIGSGITMSQSRNNAHISITGTTDFSGVYHSTQNALSLLRFVENNGNIEYLNQTMTQTMSIAGITLSENVDYLNVTYDGNIRVMNVTMQSSTTVDRQLFVAGITKTLTQGRVIRNGLVNGSIIVGSITTNQTNLTPRNNIYIAGFVNYNNSGNMDPNGNLSMPVATIGIINSINSADMSSSYGVSVRGISGHANVFAGGIVTFNDGDIQDSTNIGDICFENTSAVDTANTTFNTDSTTGGSTTKYRHGTVLGGIASAVMSAKSRIYDSSNSGTIIGLSKNFSRTGGILGLAIYREIVFGNVFSPYTSATNANIAASILSNCINYGNVSALTISISIYSTPTPAQVTMSGGIANPYRFDITQPVVASAYESTFYSTLTSGSVRALTRTSSEERPGINASSGGVIGYGLSVMRRMMNHGQISSTDVAGGVVGATVVIDTSQYVRIDTAINYGTVRAFNRGTVANNFVNFNNVDIMDYETIRDGFYAVNDPFIFPVTSSDIRLFPEDKRGFGGIFGRLQRGANLYMYGNNNAQSTFNFIVNMDPNVDLIGRLDQVTNYLSSLRFFDFTNAVYYSARKNDTTQAVFAGISFFYDNSNNAGNALTATRINRNITIQSRKYEYTYDGGSGQWLRTTYTRTMARTEIVLNGRRFVRYGSAEATSQDFQTEVISRSAGPTHGGAGWSILAGSTVPVGTLQEYKYVQDLPLYGQVWDVESTRTLGTQTTTAVPNGYYMFATTLPIPTITEESTDPQGQYVYSPSFPMQTDPILQQYIYFAENGNLSNTFINSRPNGMYVLATSSGSTFGSILPANLKFDMLLPLHDEPDGSLPAYNIDYTSHGRIDPLSDPTYQALQLSYLALFQTQFSDKSQLLAGNTTSLKLKEDGGSRTRLLNPTIVHPTESVPTGVITFNLNLNSLDFTQSNLATVNYRLNDTLLPNNAIIAKTIENYYGLPYGSDVSAYLSSYRTLLQTYADPNVPIGSKPDLEPLFTYTFNKNSPQTGLITIGYFSSFSQVAQNFTSFINDNYVSDYMVRLNVTYTPVYQDPFLYSYQIDGGTVRTTIVQNITAEPVDTSLVFNFRDPSAILPTGTDILNLGSDFYDNVTLEYFDPITSTYVLVDYADYALSSAVVSSATNRPFSLTLGVNTSLKTGLYRIGFSLLPYKETKDYYTFTKGASTLRAITSLSHYSSGTVVPSGTTLTSFVNFGYVFDFSSTTPIEVIDPLIPVYKMQTLYYTLPFLNTVVVSPFSTITSVVINPTTYTAQGFRRYNISYTVRSESGVNTVYTHTITERTISIVDVFRNNNKVVMNSTNPVIISREALSTSISINYAIDPTYSSQIYNLESDNPASYFSITPSETEGITLSVTDTYLVFVVDAIAAAGNYSFAISYNRTGETPIALGTLFMTKSQGTNAYLSDIQFAELATETNYAQINVSDAAGNIITSPYRPSIYYAGIDYDGANTAGVIHFRIDGQVSNIPLDEYIPYFLNYLPLGATISRKLSGGTYTTEVSGVDDPNVYLLAADYTASESGGDEDIIITYRVRSENGLNMVYYHITVTDITYNVSYIFDVVYQGNALKPNLSGVVIIINVRNMTTNLPVGDSVVTELPAFSTVNGYTNSTNLMYMLENPNYKFRFGRNKSGYFSFNVRILDPNGYSYKYKIELNGTEALNNIRDYDANSNDMGKYYYINSSTKNRTRSFVITIYDAQIPIRDYGFTDKEYSWKPE